MIERVHEHIITELQQNGRTDTIFILTAIALNLLTLAINSIIATGGRSDTTNIVMGMFVALLVVVNLVVIFGLLKGRETRTKLINEDLGDCGAPLACRGLPQSSEREIDNQVPWIYYW